jgi:hypothetical protein
VYTLTAHCAGLVEETKTATIENDERTDVYFELSPAPAH